MHMCVLEVFADAVFYTGSQFCDPPRSLGYVPPDLHGCFEKPWTSSAPEAPLLHFKPKRDLNDKPF